MKILELAEFYAEQGGGVRTYVDQKFEAARADGRSLTVIAPGPHDKIVHRAGGKLIWVRSPKIPIDPRYHVFWRQRPIDEIVAAERPDIIEGSSPWRGAWFAGRQSAAIPKSLIIHQDPVLTYPHTLFRNLLKSEHIDALFRWFFLYFRKLQNLFDTSVVASAWLARRLSDAGLVRPEVIPFGVDKPTFLHAPRNEDCRRAMLRQCGVTAHDAKLVITVSRHHPEKRVPMMIKAFERASQKNAMGLFIIGDGPSRKHVERLALERPGVHVAGFIENRNRLATMLASADAYLHGCPAETYGMVVAEALCAGLPQIVPDGGGAGELPSRECAEFFTPDSVDECAAAITRLLARDQDGLRRASRETGAQIGGVEQHFQSLFALYERLIVEQGAARRGEQFAVGGDLSVGQQAA